jgi:molybdopterin/thiamine biosynthesis adenylyltransferase
LRHEEIRTDAALDFIDVDKFVNDELNEGGCGAGVHIPEIDESDFVTFAEQGDIVVARLDFASGFGAVASRLRNCAACETALTCSAGGALVSIADFGAKLLTSSS